MSTSSTTLGFRGMLLDAPEWGIPRFHRDGALLVRDGKILAAGPHELIARQEAEAGIRWIHSPRYVIMPGLIDLHTHLPQYPMVARGDAELLPWLRQFIFPAERDFTGPAAVKQIPTFFKRVAGNGTTTIGAFSAIYEDTCHAAFEAARDLGIRAVIGKVMMDVGSYGHHQPRKVVSISLHESERLCKEWHGANDGLLEYAFSPRFAVSCSEKLMCGAADMAKHYGAFIQTHLAENRQEIEQVKNLFMSHKSYTDVYAKCRLLGPKTLLGHCIYLENDELALIRDAGATAVHCPTSNFFLNSGLMPLDKVRAAGINIGLGSDVAAGPELNMWRVMRSAIEAQRARGFYEPDVAKLGPVETFHLATMGGARALGKQDSLGSFDPGKEADLGVWDLGEILPHAQDEKFRLEMDAADILSLFVYRGTPSALISAYVRGRKIHAAPDRGLF